MNEIRKQLSEKRFMKVLLPSRGSSLGLRDLIILGCCNYQAQYKKPTFTQISNLTGICRDTVAKRCCALQGRGCLGSDYKPQYDYFASDLGTFHGKAGNEEYKYIMYYPPSAASPLAWIGHAIYSFLMGFTGDRLSNRYIGQVLSLNEETVAKYLEIMEQESLIALEHHGSRYSVGFYDLGERQLSFFADAGSQSTNKGVVYLGKPPGANQSGDADRNGSGEPDTKNVTDTILKSAENQMHKAGIQFPDREEILDAFRPLAAKRVWFEEIHSSCDIFKRQGADVYKKAILKAIKQRRQMQGV